MSRIDYQKLIQNVSIDEVAKRLGMDLRHETATHSKALCPFHDDTTPSLLIDSSRDHGPQHFHCYACGAHGDVIDLVKEQLKLGFKEAVEWLAPGSTNSSRRKSSVAINQAPSLASGSHSGLKLGYQLYKDGNNSTKFEAWVSERQLDVVVLRRAEFAHASSNFLSRKLDAENDASKRRELAGLLEDAHLVRKFFPGITATRHLPLSAGDSAINRYSDFFIGDRIVFPLYDENKQLVGLGGRSVEGASGSVSPKYQFTRGFPKATVLYRAEHAFEQVRSEAKKGNKNISLYLCEGFFDALRFEVLGMPAVAIMGSSVSEHQVRLLHVLSDSLPKDATLTVVISFDRDEAGLRGAADACLKLMHASAEYAPVECRFLWPTALQLKDSGCELAYAKDPNDYLQHLSGAEASQLVAVATHLPELAVLANAFGVSAEDTLNNSVWDAAPRSRRFRAFSRALTQLKKAAGKGAAKLIQGSTPVNDLSLEISALTEWITFVGESASEAHRSFSDEFLNDKRARLNHSRILAYMGSRRGELPCDEPRWERLDIAATAFNTLLIDRLGSSHKVGPVGSYDAVWVPRSFGGSEYRLKMMPRPEDLIIQQYLLNEILTERWDHTAFTGSTFSQMIPAVRYYREDRRTVTTGFDRKDDGHWGALNSQTLSFAYQIDMDVLEGRQPATDQGMYRPFHECWQDFMKSLTKQAADIGYVYSIRLDVKRYYDRLRRYVVRDQLLARLRAAIESVTDDTPGFAEFLHFEGSRPNATLKATAVLDRIDEHLFGVSYASPDTGLDKEADALMGIPQGPVLSAWIGSVALFPVDEEAYRFMDRLNTDRERVGYARYVDDIVLLADDPATLAEMRDAIDRCARKLELTLLAKADEIPAMSAEDFATYLNQGRALAASGPAWEPPLVGDGESGWEFWSVAPTTDRQSALQLLHNVELYKASKSILLQTVRTAFQASDLRTSELSKAARLIWYSIAVEQFESAHASGIGAVWAKYLETWNVCMQDAAWRLQPEKNQWESPILFALEGLEHLIDKEARDVAELSAEENVVRRRRIAWLAEQVLTSEFDSHVFTSTPCPEHQLAARLRLVRWKAMRVTGKKISSGARLYVERSKPVQDWHPFEWMHEAVSLLCEANQSGEDPLIPFVRPTADQTRRGNMSGLAADVFKALLPDDEEQAKALASGIESQSNSTALRVALHTLVSIVPKEQLLSCLNRRHRLIWEAPSASAPNRLTLPPLPGITTSRLFSCLGKNTDDHGFVIAHGFEAIDFVAVSEASALPTFLGSDGGSQASPLTLAWRKTTVEGTDGMLLRLDADLETDDYLRLRERIHTVDKDLSADVLKQAATLFRAIAQVVMTYAQSNDDKELVPAWPYIAASANDQGHYLVGDGVSRSELGNRAFVRDGGRALRTVEVPIYEASLWRVGVAISDYLGLHDDVAKFSSAELDVALDAAALENPARYVLRAQLRKLRGAYADSQISKRHSDDSMLPATVERSLRLLETFPAEAAEPLDPLFHVLAAEAESAGMYLAFQDSWECSDIASFLKVLTGRVLARLPLSIGKVLANSSEKDKGLRRDFAGLLCFARRLFTVKAASHVAELPAWTVLCSGIVSTGLSVAIDGLVASMRSHGAFERYSNFDFPNDWGIPEATPSLEGRQPLETDVADTANRSFVRVTLVEQLRRLIQHLGHRLHRTDTPKDQLSDELIERFRHLAQTVAAVETYGNDDDSLLEWPFAILSNRSLELLNLELLENVAALVKLIDEEVGFEIDLVIEQSYGYNAQTRRFTDSRGGVRDVTPWMIAQFPRNAKHIEEISSDERFLRVWSEVFDRKTSKLLSVSTLGEPFASIAISKPKLGALAGSEPQLAQTLVTLQIPTAPNPRSAQSVTKDGLFANDTTIVGKGTVLAEDDANQGGDSHCTAINSVSDASSLTPEQPPEKETRTTGFEDKINRAANEIRKAQFEHWSRRGNNTKPNGHVRVALLQANLDLTYKHPFVEASPSNWPFSSKAKAKIADSLKGDPIYGPLLRTNRQPESGHLWTGSEDLPSWSEHRRQRILGRVIDSCEALGVDLLVLPEYSIRPETLEWLKKYIANKSISILAGTYMNFQQRSEISHLNAPLSLLWPLPKLVSNQLILESQKKGDSEHKNTDFLRRGLVLEFSRNKKYRSIALEEFLRPYSDPLRPLFKPSDLVSKLAKELAKNKTELSPEVVGHLLTNTRLPLKHLLELICSEIFLVSSPANYLHMIEDLRGLRKRFGVVSLEEEEVFKDVVELSKLLSLTGDGIRARRSILAVPAATSRSADYWIAGQAGFLSAGTTTVFCNSIDGNTLVGGSCFIGRGSWKSEEKDIGYISKVTPYHGWSKGIYYNSAKDTLSKNDQAVVVADIDPHNMLEGKPRAQTMPSPLQLVAYLPLIETVNWACTKANLLRALPLPKPINDVAPMKKVKTRAQDEEKFWTSVQEANTKLDETHFNALWEMFPDTGELASRAKAHTDNGYMQPTSPHGVSGMFATPVYYDWIDVSLTLTEKQELPKVVVTSWRGRKA